MTRPCQAIGCKRDAHGQQGIWCQRHMAMVPKALKDRIFRAWASRSGGQPALIEEAKQIIAEREKTNVMPIEG